MQLISALPPPSAVQLNVLSYHPYQATTFSISAFLSMRLRMPAMTLPGPTS